MTATDSSAFPTSALDGGMGFLSAFNRYGLPGVVIGAQFIIISGLIWVMVTTLQANTKAITEFTGVVRDMKETIKEIRQ